MATKKQILKNEIKVSERGFEIIFMVNDKKIKNFVFNDLKHLVCFRELLANLPSIKAKLEILLEDDAIKWFERQINKIKTKAESSEQKKTTTKKQDKETFDLDSYLSKFGL